MYCDALIFKKNLKLWCTSVFILYTLSVSLGFDMMNLWVLSGGSGEASKACIGVWD